MKLGIYFFLKKKTLQAGRQFTRLGRHVFPNIMLYIIVPSSGKHRT